MKEEDLIHLAEDEVAVLIRISGPDAVVPITFGPGLAALRWREAKWALPVLAILRGVYLNPAEQGRIAASEGSARVMERARQMLDQFFASTPTVQGLLRRQSQTARTKGMLRK